MIPNNYNGQFGRVLRGIASAIYSRRPVSSPGMLTSRTTRGIVQRPIRRPAPPPRRAIHAVWLMEAPFLQNGDASTYALGCAFDDGDRTTHEAWLEYQARKADMEAAWLTGDAGEIDTAQREFAKKNLVVHPPQNINESETGSPVFGGGVFGTNYRISLNKRARAQSNGPAYNLFSTAPGPFDFEYQEVVSPPYLDFNRIMAAMAGTPPAAVPAQTLYVIDHYGENKRQWGTAWVDMNVDARRWVHRALAENVLKAKNGATYYDVSGFNLTPGAYDAWPD
jgi:hypothetical protein